MQAKNLHTLEIKKINYTKKSMFEDIVQKATKEKNSKDTNVNFILIDTEEHDNQIITGHKKNNMLIPIKSNKLISLNTGLINTNPRILKKLRNSKKIKLAIIYTIFLIIVVFSIGQIARLSNQKHETEELISKINSYITEDVQSNQEKKHIVDFQGLKTINPETKGWIRINGIGIDIPIVQGKDNNYYLNHSFDKSYNVCGWAFADCRNALDGTDKNIIIFGHNRKDGNIFSKMTEILNANWYEKEENKNIIFITEEGEATYEVFSIYQTKVEDYYIQTHFNSEEQYQDFLNIIESRSTKDYKTKLTAKDKILTLSTCGKDSKYRIVIHAKKL